MFTTEENQAGIIYDEKQQAEPPKNVQEQVEEQEIKKYGVISGVFIPTLLTILGVIMFLRVGWMVGNGGLLGAWLIISLSFLITSCTALSMSSFVTNTRVGAGGAFSIISQALGLEVGGSIGIPLYFSQVLAIAMYIFGFRAGWLWIFPEHSAILVDYAAFAGIAAIAFISTSFAFRIQYAILFVIFTAIGSICLSGFLSTEKFPIQWWGEFPGHIEKKFSGIGFWGVFAVFFPASTGIMAGANMSGELKDPRWSIPIGTMAAVVLSYVIYLILAYFSAISASPDDLVSNYTLVIDQAYWSPIVVAGLLGATFSSALASFVGAPRILQALGSHNILPMGVWLAARTKKGEPLHAMSITALLVFFSLLLRDLNMVAPLITMTFLITYCMINLVVFLEMQLKLLSFRPTFRVPKFITCLGFIGSIFAMFIISPIFGLLASIFVLAIFVFLMKKELKSPFSDVRSGLFTAFAEWAAKKIKLMHAKTERAWKPNILLPVEDISRLHGIFGIIFEIAQPTGSVKILGVTKREHLKEFEQKINDVSTAYLNKGVFSSFSVLEEEHFSEGIIKGVEALRGSFFRPNVLCLELPKDQKLHKNLWKIADVAHYSKMGLLLLVDHPTAGIGQKTRINIWIPNQKEWKVQMHFPNLDLAILVGYSLYQNWGGELRLYTQVSEKKSQKTAAKFLDRLIHLARIPATSAEVFVAKSLQEAVKEAPHADLNLFPLEGNKVQELWNLRDAGASMCVFCKDSGEESAIA